MVFVVLVAGVALCVVLGGGARIWRYRLCRGRLLRLCLRRGLFQGRLQQGRVLGGGFVLGRRRGFRRIRVFGLSIFGLSIFGLGIRAGRTGGAIRAGIGLCRTARRLCAQRLDRRGHVRALGGIVRGLCGAGRIFQRHAQENGGGVRRHGLIAVCGIFLFVLAARIFFFVAGGFVRIAGAGVCCGPVCRCGIVRFLIVRGLVRSAFACAAFRGVGAAMLRLRGVMRLLRLCCAIARARIFGQHGREQGIARGRRSAVLFSGRMRRCRFGDRNMGCCVLCC